MADNPVTIQGSTQKARGDGTSARKSTRDSLSTFAKVGISLVIIAFIIVLGYWLAGWFQNSDRPDASTQPGSHEPNLLRAGSSGTIIAPASNWSSWYEFPSNRCVYGWGDDPNGSRFKIRWMDRNGDIWSYDGTQARNLRAFSVRSNANTPQRVQYEVRPRINGRCPEL